MIDERATNLVGGVDGTGVVLVEGGGEADQGGGNWGVIG